MDGVHQRSGNDAGTASASRPAATTATSTSHARGSRTATASANSASTAGRRQSTRSAVGWRSARQAGIAAAAVRTAMSSARTAATRPNRPAITSTPTRGPGCTTAGRTRTASATMTTCAATSWYPGSAWNAVVMTWPPATISTPVSTPFAACRRVGTPTSSAASPGPTSPVTRPYPNAVAAVSAHSSAAYRRGGSASATPNRLTYHAAYPSSRTSSSPSAANVSAVPASRRSSATGGTASTSTVTTPRIAARPTTPKLAHATAVKTTAALPRSSPPRTNSTFCTAFVDASGRAAGTGASATGASATGRGSGGAAPTRAAHRSAAVRATTRRARPFRWDTVAFNRPVRSANASRAASTSARSPAMTRSSATTSAASGSGGRPHAVQPVRRSAAARQAGHGYAAVSPPSGPVTACAPVSLLTSPGQGRRTPTSGTSARLLSRD